MEIINWCMDFVLHLDRHLEQITSQYQVWTYLLLFLVVYCETGLVITPYLPGDSLLFASGAIAALNNSAIEVGWVYLCFFAAAILGDTTNYFIGRAIGPKIFHKEKVRFLNKEYLERAHKFYERHGGKTVFLARFMPILRTFAPFVAGIGRMGYPRFLMFSVTGTIAWVGTFVLGGYFFGNIPLVKKNFTLVIMAIIVISLIPACVTYLKHKFGKPVPATAQAEAEKKADNPENSGETQ